MSCTISSSKCAWRSKKLGYDNYTELAYRNMGRLDYTPEHVEKFREQIRTVITPAVDRMRKAQAKRLGFGFRQILR